MKIIKKVLIALCLVFALAFLVKVPVNADELVVNDNIVIEGASVRLTGNAGIRFQATVGTYDTTDVVKYGILISYGCEVAGDFNNPVFDNMVKGGTVNGKAVLSVEVDEVDAEGKYYATIYNIPESGYIQEVYARPYVVLNDESIVYGEDYQEYGFNSLANLCVTANENSIEGDIIDEVLATIDIYEFDEVDNNVLNYFSDNMMDPYRIVNDDFEFTKEYIAIKRVYVWDNVEYPYYQFYKNDESYLFDNLTDALNITEEIDGYYVIYVASGTYPEDFTIEDSKLWLYGPNYLNDLDDDRVEEANITGKLTIAAEVAELEIIGLKFSGEAQIIGDCNTADELVCYNIYDFRFYNNYVVSGLSSGKGFMDFDTKYGSSKYRYNDYFQFSNNHFETTSDYAATKFLYFGDNTDLYFNECEFINVKKDCIYVQDHGKGLAGDFGVNDCHFKNIGGYGININWVASLKSDKEALYRNTISIFNNYFESIAAGNVCAYINFEDSNNLQNYYCFEIVFNTFKGNTRVLWFDGRIATGADFNYNKIYTNNSENYICKSDFTTAAAASNCEIDCSNNIYIDMADDTVITGANINASLFQPAIAKNYTTSFDTLEAYETAVNALLN